MKSKILRLIGISLIIFFGILMLKITIPNFSNQYDSNFLLTKYSVLHLRYWRWAFYIHISTALVIYFIGGFQFLTFFRINFPVVHKVVGKIYVFGILFLAGPSAVLMGINANGGISAKISFVLLSFVWLTVTYLQYFYRKDILKHISFSIRSYSLTLSAISFRLFVFLLPTFFILPSSTMYALIAWLSWIPNVLLAELIIFVYLKKIKQ